jgi:hypothetical protein
MKWQPTIALRDGLQKTIAYFKELLRTGDGPLGVGANRAL